jgi:hypothetical protein
MVAERQDFWLEAKKINGLSALNIFNNMKVWDNLLASKNWGSVSRATVTFFLLKGQCHEIFDLWFFSPINPT